MQARWMDNSTGRFISIDPIQDGYNWYAYCEGNPVTYVDPTGLKPLDETGGSTITIPLHLQPTKPTFSSPGTTTTFGGPKITGGGFFKPTFGTELTSNINLTNWKWDGSGNGNDDQESPHIDRSGPLTQGMSKKEREQLYIQREVRKKEKANYNYTENTENIGNKLVLSYSADITRGTVYSEEAREYLLYSVEQTRRALEDGNVTDEIPDAEELSKFKATLEYYEGRLVKANISYDIKAESRPKVGITGGFIYYEEKESGDSILPNNDAQRSYSYGHPKNYYFGLASGAAQPTYDETLIVDGFTLSRGLFKDRVAIKEGVKSAKNGLPKLFRNSKYALGAALGMGDDGLKRIAKRWPWKRTKIPKRELIAGAGRCADWADDLQKAIGGEIIEIKSIYAPGEVYIGAINLPNGTTIGLDVGWKFHRAVRIGEMIFDRMTGPAGMYVDDYMKMFEWSEDLFIEVIKKGAGK